MNLVGNFAWLLTPRPYHQQLNVILQGIRQESKYITHLDISVCIQYLLTIDKVYDLLSAWWSE